MKLELLAVLPALLAASSPLSVHGANCSDAQVLAVQQNETAGCGLWVSVVGATVDVDKFADPSMCKNETCVENLGARAQVAPDCEAYGVNMKTFFDLSAQFCGNSTQAAYNQLLNISRRVIAQRKDGEYHEVPSPTGSSSKVSSIGAVAAGVAVGLAAIVLPTL